MYVLFETIGQHTVPLTIGGAARARCARAPGDLDGADEPRGRRAAARRGGGAAGASRGTARGGEICDVPADLNS